MYKQKKAYEIEYGIVGTEMARRDRLDTNVHHLWPHAGHLYPVYSATSGVKQGGPLSAILFVIALDPFVHALATYLPAPIDFTRLRR